MLFFGGVRRTQYLFGCNRLVSRVRPPRGGESGSNGLLLDEEGRLLLAQHGDRRIARLESSLHAPESQFTTLSDSFNGLRFNSPNDLARRSNGDLYFTDPPYGLEGRGGRSVERNGYSGSISPDY